MRLIDTLTNNPNQKITFVLDDNSSFELTLNYQYNQQWWFYSFNYQDKVIINNNRLVVGLNLLRQYKNLLPFGITVLSNTNSEPNNLTDFINPSSEPFIQLLVLTSAELLLQEQNYE